MAIWAPNSFFLKNFIYFFILVSIRFTGTHRLTKLVHLFNGDVLDLKTLQETLRFPILADNIFLTHEYSFGGKVDMKLKVGGGETEVISHGCYLTPGLEASEDVMEQRGRKLTATDHVSGQLGTKFASVAIWAPINFLLF